MPVNTMFNLYKYDNTIAHENVLEMNDFEYGSNTNGEYWKLANGLMICTMNIVLQQNESSKTFEFPCTFIENPTVLLTNIFAYNSSIIWSTGSQTPSSIKVFGHVSSGTLAGIMNAHLAAIGRWK